MDRAEAPELVELRRAVQQASTELLRLSMDAGADEATGATLQGLGALLGTVAGTVDNEAEGRAVLAEAVQRAEEAGRPEVGAQLQAWGCLLLPGEDPAAVLQAIEVLEDAGQAAQAIATADRLLRTLRRRGADEQVATLGIALANRTWPHDHLEAALGLRATLGESLLLSGDRVGGEDELRRVEARCQLHSLWRPLHQVAMARSFRAEQDGQVPLAEHHADLARRLAVAHADGQRYLAAAMRLSGLAELRGDRVQAYGILVSAVKSLTQLLGPSFEPTGQRILQATRERWGEEATNAAAQGFIDARRGSLES